MKNTHMKFLLIPALLACTFAAQAQSAGTMLIRVGATNITPNVTSDDLTAPSLVGTKSSIGSSSRLSGGITYMVDDHFAIDLPLAIPFQHDISGDGAIRGAGITYAAFYGARSTSTLTALTGGTPANPTTLSVDSKWAASFQLGATFQMSGGWFIDANYVYTPLRTRTTLSTGQTLDATLNPSAVSLAVGMKF